MPSKVDHWIPIAQEKPPLNVPVWLYWGGGPDKGYLCEGYRMIRKEYEIYHSVYAGSVNPTHWYPKEQLPPFPD